MKNTLAENMRRFGTKNLTESDSTLLTEQAGYRKGAAWANSQKSVRALLSKHYLGNTPNGDGVGIWPVPVIKCGPYLLQVYGENPVPQGNSYEGHIYALLPSNGVMKLTDANSGECGRFMFHPAQGFRVFKDEMRLANYDDASIDAAWKTKAINGKTADLKSMFSEFYANLNAEYKSRLNDKLQAFAKDPSSRSQLTGRAKNFNVIFAGMTSQTPG